MKGLLLKDFFTLFKQAKLFLLFILVFSLLPGYSMSTFAIIYAAMLPVTALAYDERSKWDSLAAMLPYSARSLVLSKYLLGYGAVGLVFVLSALVQRISSLVQNQPAEPEQLVSLLILTCLATLIQSVNLPFMFKLGVERGRIVFYILLVLLVVVIMAVSDQLTAMLEQVDLLRLSLICLVGTLIINLVSIEAAVRLYKNRKN